MLKPDKDGIVRVTGAEAIAKAHSNPDLIEIGGNSMAGWAEFKVIEKMLAMPKKPKVAKEVKKDVE